MSDTVDYKRTADLPVELREKHVTTQETYLAGPRYALPASWIERAAISFNADTAKLGWEPIVVTARERTSLFERTIFFSVQGQAYPVLGFNEFVREAVRGFGGVID